VFYAFDLLHLDGSISQLARSSSALPKKILPKENIERIHFTDYITGDGEALFQRLEARNLEGMVMKRKDSVYSGLPNRDWLKVKTPGGRMTIQKRIETWG
jgi:bifunctional non-homologous end joining protein LigD